MSGAVGRSTRAPLTRHVSSGEHLCCSHGEERQELPEGYAKEYRGTPLAQTAQVPGSCSPCAHSPRMRSPRMRSPRASLVELPVRLRGSCSQEAPRTDLAQVISCRFVRNECSESRLLRMLHSADVHCDADHALAALAAWTPPGSWERFGAEVPLLRLRPVPARLDLQAPCKACRLRGFRDPVNCFRRVIASVWKACHRRLTIYGVRSVSYTHLTLPTKRIV